MPAHDPIEIGLVVYPGVQLAAVYGLTDLFAVADRFAGEQQKREQGYLSVSQWQLGDRGEPPVRDATGSPSGDKAPTVLILPPCLNGPPTAEIAAPFTGWLRNHHRAGTTISSICAGAFILAETGLLDGRQATTHWALADKFQERFPGVMLDADKLVVDDGDIVSAGGLMAWADLGLKLVDRFLGPTIMARTARFLLVDPSGREQRYYSAFSPNLTHGDTAILRVQHALQASGAKDANLEMLAAHAGLEERTFLRRFRKATGLSPIDYCQRLRVGKAQELLQFSTLSVEAIAWEVGYSDQGAFRKVFGRVTGLTPGEYRKRFSVGSP